MFCIFVHYSTWSIYDVSMSFFCWHFNILPGFLWQPFLIQNFWRASPPLSYGSPPSPPGTAGDNWRSSPPSLGWRRYLSDVIIFEWSYYLHLSPGGGEGDGCTYMAYTGRNPIEFVQTKFIRWLLGVNKFCSSNACRSEVGQFPTRTKTKRKAIKFWLKFCELEDQKKLSGISFADLIGQAN